MLDSKKISVVIALGYFDSVHIGHQKVISTAVARAKELGVTPATFSFDGNLRKFIGGADGKYVFTTAERKRLIYNLGVEEILFAPVTKTFLSKGKLFFLNYLNDIYDVKGYVSGEDYRFGHNGLGDVGYLKEYAEKRGQFVVTVPAVTLNEKRVSTTYIKSLLLCGDITTANAMLGGKYFVTGKVLKGRKVGRKIGFPTVNLPINADRSPVKYGVYSATVNVDGKEYKAVVNYGERPTYELYDRIVEAHIIDYEGDLYGKDLKIYFESYLRDIIKFNGEAELIEQLKKDVSAVKGDTI